VRVDTYSGVLFASAHTGETTKQALGHLLGALQPLEFQSPSRQTMVLSIQVKNFKNSVNYGTLLTILEFLTILKASPL
jgi:hypothetical protein